MRPPPTAVVAAASAAKRSKFGWDWWAWNVVLAATPATILWYGLSRTRQEMRGEVSQLKAAIAEEKQQALERKKTLQQRRRPLPAEEKSSIEGLTPEERLARLEARLASIEGHLRVDGKGEEEEEEEKKGNIAASLLSGVRRRVMGQYEAGVAEAFARLKMESSAGEAAGGPPPRGGEGGGKEEGKGKG